MSVRHAFSVDEWHRMGEIGLFDEEARVELLDGEVIEMSPIGSRHSGAVIALNRLLVPAVGDRALVEVQGPVTLDERSEPQPDLALLAPRADGYRHSHAGPDEVLLLVEVSDRTLAFDRDRKSAVYARTGVGEYWVVDLTSEVVLVMREPGHEGYRRVDVARRGESIAIERLPGVSVPVDEVLGPD